MRTTVVLPRKPSVLSMTGFGATTMGVEPDTMVWRRDLRAYFGDVSDETVRR